MKTSLYSPVFILVCVIGLSAYQFAFHEWKHLYADQASHLIAAQSIWYDGDLKYTEGDLERFREATPFANGPRGMFLKIGSNGDFYYAKPMLYALLAAPLIPVAGLDAFLFLNIACFLVLLVTFLLSVSHLTGRNFAAAMAVGLFVFSPFWAWTGVIHPDLLIAALLAGGGYLLIRAQGRPAMALLGGTLIGLCIYEKATFIIPATAVFLAACAWRMPSRSMLLAIGGVVVAVALPTAVQLAQDGNFTAYQGVRFYVSGNPFPLEAGWQAPAQGGADHIFSIGNITGALLANFALLPEKVGDFLVGRQTGLLPYFGAAAILLGLVIWAGRKSWRAWLVIAGAFGLLGLYWIAFPANGYGGSQSFGSRYLMQLMPAFWLAAAVIDDPPRLNKWAHRVLALFAIAIPASLHPSVPIRGAEFVQKPSLFLESAIAQAFPLERTLAPTVAPMLSRQAYETHDGVTLFRLTGKPMLCHSMGLDGGRLLLRMPADGARDVGLRFEVSRPVRISLVDGAKQVASLEAHPEKQNDLVLSRLSPNLRYRDLSRGSFFYSDLGVSVTALAYDGAHQDIPFLIKPTFPRVDKRVVGESEIPLSRQIDARDFHDMGIETSLCWSYPERDGRWTSGKVGRMSMYVPESAERNLHAQIEFVPMVPLTTKQEFALIANGAVAYTREFLAGDSGRSTANFVVKPEWLSTDRRLQLLVQVSRPSRPAGRTADARLLGAKVASIRFSELPNLGLGELISFDANSNGSLMLGDGWWAAESWGVWSRDRLAVVHIPLPPGIQRPLRLTFDVQAYLNSLNSVQVVEVEAGKERARWVFDQNQNQGARSLVVDSVGDDLVVAFRIDAPHAPNELAAGDDPRKLGLALRSLLVTEVWDE